MFLLYFIRAPEQASDDPALSTDLVVQPGGSSLEQRWSQLPHWETLGSTEHVSVRVAVCMTCGTLALHPLLHPGG